MFAGETSEAGAKNLSGRSLTMLAQETSAVRAGAALTAVVGLALICGSLSCGGVASSSTKIVPPSSAIPASFYGFTINKSCSISQTDASGQSCSNPENHNFPGLPFTLSRSLGTGRLRWSDLVECDPTGSSCAAVSGCQPNARSADDPTNCAYDWTGFDFWTKTYNSHGVDWMYDLYYTPDYLSVRGSRCTGPGTPDSTCVGPADVCGGGGMGGCDPPYDVDSAPGNGDGKGTNQNYKNFVTALLAHLQANGEQIQYWEVWNEPNICIEWNHADQQGVDCSSVGGGTPSTGTVAQLVRMAADARSILPSSVKVTTPPVTDVAGIKNYLNQILASGGSSFDVVDFHGYFNAQNGACPTACPTPETFLTEWSTLQSVMSGAGVAAKPAMNTEFSWGAESNTTDPDMRAAFAARSYLLQESEYPALARVNWYGEDFQENLSINPKTGEPFGGSGEFWASGTDNVADNCLTPDPVQGGFDCPAGLAMTQVSKWTVGGGFDAPCSCSGANCSATPPKGVFQCKITQANGHLGLFVWDNTAGTFPCSNPACGGTSFDIPSSYNSDWQDLDGTTHQLSGSTTVTIGAKPILIEN
jgi:hypothetical protein